MVDRLERGFRSQRQFLDDIAHELRTPITIARGHLDTLGDDPDERAETVAIVSDELDHMSRYVSELLLLAKAERPDFLALGPVDLGDLAATLMQRVSGLEGRRWVLDEAPPPGAMAVVADQDRLEQAVLNLAANAVNHTRPGSEVGIGVRVVGEQYELWVRDTGRGIDPALAESLFDRYARGATNRTSRTDGMGLGLSIVEAIATAHGGTVHAVSPPGSGATLILTLPADPEALAARQPPPDDTEGRR